MSIRHPLRSAIAAAAVLSLTTLTGAAQAAGTLEGWALMPAATFAPGPTSGQFAFTNNASPANNPPYLNAQPVQGFSAVLQGASAGSYYVMPDNGFGSKASSADTLLRVYSVTPDFRTASGGSGTVAASSYATGAALGGFTSGSYITLADPDRKLGFAIQADYANYYNSTAANAIAVDPAIKAGRLLTGADFDIESVRKDKNGNLWFGEEFGPFLVKTDATGKVLRQEIPLPNFKPAGSTSTGAFVMSPSNPYLGSGASNLRNSNGFEGMAINRTGDKLFTLLEGTVAGDDATNKALRIDEFSIDTEAYTGRQWLYKLDAAGTNIGDMTAVNDHQFLVLERNGGTATSGTPFKKVFLIDTAELDAAGFAKKTEIVDLMNVADPHDLNGDGSTTFTFPYVTIEDVLIVDSKTLLIINDNNFPGGGGRALTSDNTEFLKIGLSTPLNVSAVPEPGSYALMLGGLALLGAAARRRQA